MHVLHCAVETKYSPSMITLHWSTFCQTLRYHFVPHSLLFINSQVIGEGNDWLFLVIADIAQTQTLFVENLYAEIESSLGTHRLARLLPKDPAHVYPAEASVFTAIVRPDQK